MSIFPRKTKLSVPTSLSQAEDRRKSCFFMGKTELCNPVNIS